MNAPVLSLERLSIDYATPSGWARAVDDVSLDIGPGEIFGLCGESGSGKSTLARGFLRLLGPPAVIRRGRALLAGRDLLAMGEAELRGFRWRQVSMVFQSALDALCPVLRVEDQLVDLLLAHRPQPLDEARSRAVALLEAVGIPAARARAYPFELSGGMRQRVIIAMALALSPKLVVMDEPTTALDVVVQHEIWTQLLELRARHGFAVLLISHDLPMMTSVADRIGVMYAGRLVELAPTAALRARPRHPYTRGLLGAFPPIDGPKLAMRGIPGAPPSIEARPTGCAFSPRCSEAVARCRRDPPTLERAPDGHVVACHARTWSADTPLTQLASRAPDVGASRETQEET
jgi:peptide/nickel transport system ATP-binding protein